MAPPTPAKPDPGSAREGKRALFAGWEPAVRVGCIAALALALAAAVVLAYLFPIWRP
jgi:hypothetical protein